MIVALSIKSESGDSYLELFKDKTISEIKDELLENKECYYGCNIDTAVLDCTFKEETDLIEMLRDFSEESWNFD